MRWLALALLLVPQETALRAALGPIRSIDPAYAAGFAERTVADALFPDLGPDAKVDGSSVTYRLPERKWSDGKPVTAEDFRHAWLRCLNPATGSAWSVLFHDLRNAAAYEAGLRLSDRLLSYESDGNEARLETKRLALETATPCHVASMTALGWPDVVDRAKSRRDVLDKDVGVEAVDARTLKVTFADRPVSLVATAFRAVPRHALKPDWTHPDRIVTSGAYAIDRWTRDEVALRRVGAGPSPAIVVMKLPVIAQEAWVLYEGGLLDWIDRDAVPEAKIEALKKSGDLRASPGPAVLSLVVATKGPLAKDPLKAALAKAFDRAPIAAASGPGSVPADGSAQDLASVLTAFLAEAPDLSKFPKINLLYWKSPEIEAVARVARDQLQNDLALRVRIDVREWPAYAKAFEEGDYDLALQLQIRPSGIPLVRPGTWTVAKPHVTIAESRRLADVRIKK